MKRTSSMAFFNDPNNKRVTRAQVQFIKSIFPFLDLPGELRNKIYAECFSFKGIERFYDKVYEHVRAQADGTKEKGTTKVAIKSTPTILLLNRQIFNEAISFIRQCGVIFHHGQLNTKLTKVIQPSTLQQLSSIEITDDGHGILEHGLVSHSWHGYTKLIRELADILEGGHNLKNFVLRLTGPGMHEHMTTCVHGDWNCGFRDQMQDAVNTLRKVRGVQNVTFTGINEDWAKDLKRRMQSPKVINFNDMPQEIKDMIYDYALDWSDISKALKSSVTKWESPKDPFPYPKLTTPTVLLLNKKITKDALAILHKKPLNIDFPAEQYVSFDWKLPRLKNFITMDTLKSVKTLNVSMAHWKWAWTVIHPLSHVIKNCDKLTKLTISVKDAKKEALIEMPRENYAAVRFHRDFQHLIATRDVSDFGCLGDVPDLFINPLVHIMLCNNPMKKFWHALPKKDTLLGKLVSGYEK